MSNQEERITKTQALDRIGWECLTHIGDKHSLADKIMKIIDLTRHPSRRHKSTSKERII